MNKVYQDLPASPVVKTACFHSRIVALIPGQRTEVSYTVKCGLSKQTLKKKKKKGYIRYGSWSSQAHSASQ